VSRKEASERGKGLRGIYSRVIHPRPGTRPISVEDKKKRKRKKGSGEEERGLGAGKHVSKQQVQIGAIVTGLSFRKGQTEKRGRGTNGGSIPALPHTMETVRGENCQQRRNNLEGKEDVREKCSGEALKF